MATAKKAAATKTAAKKTKAPKKASTKQPSLTRTVNMGPLRGDNSFPPGNKPMSKDTSRAPGKKGQKGGGKDE
jgi:hypothetical protein